MPTSPAAVAVVHQPRRAVRRPLRLPGRLVWRDHAGALRFVAVETRDVSESDVWIVCQTPTSIPLYRLVHFQIEPASRAHPDLPAMLRRGRLLAAVFRVGPRQRSTGTPTGYSLRLLIESRRAAQRAFEPLVARR